MNEELIQQIVCRILSEPAFQAILQGTGTINGSIPPRTKPDSLVLLNYVPDFERVLTAVQKRWGVTNILYVLPSESVRASQPELPEGMMWITPQDALSRRNWQTLLLPACSLNTLAKMALGIRDNPFTEIVGRGIISGIPIQLVTEFFGLNSQTPLTYSGLYSGYVEKVQTYGVQVYATLEEGHLYEPGIHMCEQRTTAITQEQPIRSQVVLRFEKKLLSDKDACGFPEDTRVLIPPRVVISPLARDTLRMRRIELCQEREEQRR